MSASSAKKKPKIFPAIEVFSIFIGCESNQALSLYGAIEVGRPPGFSFIFNKAKEDPMKLPQGGMFIPISDFPCVLDDYLFEIRLELGDADSPKELKGYMCWLEPHVRDLYGRRLCSVIRGKDCYAAVHYSLFSDAVLARVNVSFKRTGFISNMMHPRVYGSIFAKYSNRDYSASYGKFRTVLFDKTPEDALSLIDSQLLEIQLHKCAFCVPFDCSMVIDLAITVLDQQGSSQHLRASAEFQINENVKGIRKEGFDLEIRVDWKLEDFC